MNGSKTILEDHKKPQCNSFLYLVHFFSISGEIFHSLNGNDSNLQS